MKRTITIIAFLITSINLFGQYRDSTSWIVKINAPALIDVTTFPTLSLSLEKRLTQHFSLSGEIGYQLFSPLHKPDTTWLETRGYKANIEARYYFSSLFKRYLLDRRHLMSGAYVAVQVFHRSNQFTSSVYYTTINQESATDYFGVKKTASGANLKFGIQKCKRRFVIDLYIGLGVMNRQIINTNRKYNQANGDTARAEDFGFDSDRDFSESSGVVPNATVGVRLGYKLSL